jgi:LytS/YehU family sensor histidine kinase
MVVLSPFWNCLYVIDSFHIQKTIKLFRTKQKKKVKTQQKILELQQKALASNLNPHFVFNSLKCHPAFYKCEKQGGGE